MAPDPPKHNTLGPGNTGSRGSCRVPVRVTILLPSSSHTLPGVGAGRGVPHRDGVITALCLVHDELLLDALMAQENSLLFTLWL